MPTYTGYRPYGQIASETIVTPAGAPFTGTLTLYAAQTGTGTADAKADATGNAITTISVTAGVAARFHVVEGGEAWVDTAGGRGKLLPNDVGTKAGPAGANGSPGQQGNTGPGVPAGGTTGQVLRKTSDQANATEWADPVAAPLEVSDATLANPSGTPTGVISGRRFFAAFLAYYASTGQPWVVKWTGTAWPARTTVPTAWTGEVLWDSRNDANATAPPQQANGEDWLQFVDA